MDATKRWFYFMGHLYKLEAVYKLIDVVGLITNIISICLSGFSVNDTINLSFRHGDISSLVPSDHRRTATWPMLFSAVSSIKSCALLVFYFQYSAGKNLPGLPCSFSLGHHPSRRWIK